MTDRTPLKATIVSGAAAGLAEYAAGDTVPVTNGGTGSTTATGTGSAVLANSPTLVAPKANAIQLGTSGTNSQNFVWSTGADGTMKLARGIVGTTTQDILTVNAAGEVNIIQPQPWVASNPAATPGSGGLGSAVSQLRVRKEGKTVFYQYSLDISSIGTAAFPFTIPLPYTAATTAALNEWNGIGRESRQVGYALVAWVKQGTSSLVLANAVTATVGNNHLLNVSGFYESAI